MKAPRHPSRGPREDDPDDVRRRREDLFDLAYPWAQRAANVRACYAPRYDYFDRDDLTQDALTAVFSALDRYEEPRAALRTFVEHVVASGIASSLRRARTAKRTCVEGWRPVESPALSLIVELKLDLNRVLQTLKRLDRKVAALLEEYRPAEIARMLAIPRSTVHRSIGRIREAFVNAGFR